MQENDKIENAPLESTGGDQPRIPKDKKDIWDIIGAVGRFLGSVVAAIAMVFVAILGSTINERTSEWDQTFRSQELEARKLELQSSRELSANQLRGDVFSSIGQYVAPLLGEDDEKLALLAGLHTNFGAFYDTRPVFAAFARDIKGIGSRQELKRLAKRAARLQVEALRSEGGTKTELIPLQITWTRTEGQGAGDPTTDEEPETFTLAGHSFLLRVVDVSRKYGSDRSDEVMAFRDFSDDTTDDVEDLVTVRFSEVHNDDEVIRNQFQFELSYMDSPYIDNMSFFEGYGRHDKLAFVLVEVDEVDGVYEIYIDAVHFPAGLIPNYRMEITESNDGDQVDQDHAEDVTGPRG